MRDSVAHLPPELQRIDALIQRALKDQMWRAKFGSLLRELAGESEMQPKQPRPKGQGER